MTFEEFEARMERQKDDDLEAEAVDTGPGDQDDDPEDDS